MEQMCEGIAMALMPLQGRYSAGVERGDVERASRCTLEWGS